VGFVEAGKLQVGDKLLDSKGNVLVWRIKSLRLQMSLSRFITSR